MIQVFADISSMRDDLLSIGGEDYNHIRNVLRMRVGEELSVRDARGGSGDDEYRFAIEDFSQDRVICRLLFVRQAGVELPVHVLLYQGLPKADKMDFIVQKAVEMGVGEVIPVQMRRSVVKLSGDRQKKRVARWQSIAEAAAGQAKRAIIPQVAPVLAMEAAIRDAAARADLVLLPYERLAGVYGGHAGQAGTLPAAGEPMPGQAGTLPAVGASMPGQEGILPWAGDRGSEAGTAPASPRQGACPEPASTRHILESLRPGQTIAVFIGPEGGFDASEVAAAVGQGARTISLGRRILRTETAALAFLSFLIYRFELGNGDDPAGINAHASCPMW